MNKVIKVRYDEHGNLYDYDTLKPVFPKTQLCVRESGVAFIEACKYGVGRVCKLPKHS